MNETTQLWAAVDRLTKHERRTVERDDGTKTAAIVPSLWAQAMDALRGGLEGGGVKVGAPDERSPVDLALVEFLAIIQRMTRRELRRLHSRPRAGVPAQLRQLASVALAREPEQLWWWAYRFDQWARTLALLIAANERQPSALRLRNAPCPLCGSRQVVIETAEGPVVAPPILIDFQNGLVRAAHCTACDAMWWRGIELELLADSLGCARTA